MSQNILELAYQLTQAGEPFVMATIVWCERPTSAKPGAQAIIQADGLMTGWIGGSCAQPTVVREALRVLREGGEPYLLRLGTPEHAAELVRSDLRVFPMSCASGGTLDIYIEPHRPRPQLLLIGDSPVIIALRELAPVLDFSVTQLEHADLSQSSINEQTCILVATHGQYDENALEQALRSPAQYVALVGSQRRAESCRLYLRESGLSDQQIARLKAPAGLNIGAVTPTEIAASILAELVQVQRQPLSATAPPASSVPSQQSLLATPLSEPSTSEEATTSSATTAIDPVCGMSVEIATARHQTTHEGRDFYFCCPACKRLFERNPQEYLVHHDE